MHGLGTFILFRVRKAGAIDGLLVVVDRQHSIGHRGRLIERDARQALRHGIADVIKVRGATTNNAAQRNHGIMGARGGLGHDGQFEGPDHAQGRDRGAGGFGSLERSTMQLITCLLYTSDAADDTASV